MQSIHIAQALILQVVPASGPRWRRSHCEWNADDYSGDGQRQAVFQYHPHQLLAPGDNSHADPDPRRFMLML